MKNDLKKGNLNQTKNSVPQPTSNPSSRLKIFSKKIIIIYSCLFVLTVILTVWARSIDHQRRLAGGLVVSGAQETQSLLNFNQAALAINNSSSQAIPQIGASDHYLGSLEAKVKMIVFEDPTDLYAANLNDNLKKLVEIYGQHLVIAFRPWRLTKNNLVDKTLMALACANEQNKFLEMRDVIFKKVQEQKLSLESLASYAGEVKLNPAKFTDCLKNDKYQTAIESALAAAKNYQVYGSPTIFINQEIVTGARGLEDTTNSTGQKILGLKTIVDQELKK